MQKIKDPERLAALRRAVLLDTPAEEAFDRLTLLATRILDVPVSLVSLVDAERQFFKSCVGLPEPWASERETPLSHSFCQHTVATGEPFVIDDARENPLVLENLAIRDLNVIAYAGIPLELDGQVLGSFCVIDSEPRAWKETELDILRSLAESVMTEIRLRIVEEELRQALRDRDDVLAMVSHDLRNPLSLVLSASEILRRRTDLEPERRAQQVDLINRAARRMHTLVSDLVDHARLEAGVLRLNRAPTSIAGLMDEAARHAGPAAEREGVELSVRAPEPDIEISADHDRLLQALDNLLSNAVRLTPEGGRVELSAGLVGGGDGDSEPVEGPGGDGAGGAGPARVAWIAVEDTGPGIEAEDIPRLFDRFFQAGHTRRGSAGLGLAIVKAVVDAHGGEIDVRSEPGEGARFELRLPTDGG